MVIEREGVQNLAEMYANSDHSFINPSGTAGGVKKVTYFNMTPGGFNTDGNVDTFQFKAGEKINVRAENILPTPWVWNTTVKGMAFYLYYTFDNSTPESLASARYGGGLPGGGVDGGGGGVPPIVA